MTVRRAARGLAAGGVVALLLTGCGSDRAAPGGQAAQPDPERDAALEAAHQVQGRVEGTFLVATYRPDAGERRQSNTGQPCSGRTVQVRLEWRGANFSHGGSTGDDRQALIVTANVATGQPCLIGASYGARSSDPTPGEIYLYGPRKDLVP